MGIPTRVTRHNLSGGKIGRQMVRRSDLEQYHKGNFTQTNFLATPYGGIVRREPATWLGFVPLRDDDVAPSVVRGFSFVRTLTEKYSVLLVGYADTGASEFLIFRDTGEFVTTAPTIFDSTHIYELDVKQINDVMIITHVAYPPSQLIRYSDTNWQIQDREILGGPFLEVNFNDDLVLSSGATQWDELIQYFLQDDYALVVGDWVLPKSTTFLTVNWVGTLMSHEHESTLNTEHDFTGDDPYWKERDTIYGTSNNKYSLTDIEYPYLLMRVDDPVSVDEGIGVSVTLDGLFVEQENDISYNVTGTIVTITDKGAYHYLTVDCGMKVQYQMKSRLDFGLELIVFARNHNAVPNPELQAGSNAGYQPILFRDFPHPSSSPDLVYVDYNQYSFQNDDRRQHLFLFGNPNAGGYGGAFVIPNLNLSVGDTSLAYDAIADSQNDEPPSSSWALRTPTDRGTVQDIVSTGFSEFDESWVGRLLWIENFDNTSIPFTFNGTFATSDVRTEGLVTFRTSGTWTGTIVLESRPYYSSTAEYEVIAEFVSNNDFNGEVTRTIPFGHRIRARMVLYTSGTCEGVILYPNGESPTLEILKVVSSNKVTARVLSGTHRYISNYKWKFGAFGGEQGYPSVWSIHEERLIYGSTLERPFQMWGSEVNNWVQFSSEALITETSPIIFRLLSDNITQIKWLLSRSSRLYIGTDFGEYVATTPDEQTVISALNPPRITLTTPYGSSRQNALAVDDQVIHVIGDRQTVRAITEREYTTTETSHSLTIFNPEISLPAIQEMHLQRNPYTVIWCLREDGVLIPFTYDTVNNVMGWAEIEIADSDIKSHWIIPNDQGIDEVYFVDNRLGQIFYASEAGIGITLVPTAYRIRPTDTVQTAVVTGAGSGPYGSMDDTYTRDGQLNSRDKLRFPYPAELIGPDPHYRFEYGNSIEEPTDEWIIRTEVGNRQRYYTGPYPDLAIPPRTGWDNGTTAVAFDPILIFSDSPTGTYDHYVDLYELGTYAIYDATTHLALYESPTLEGEYTPVAGSGMIGTVTIQELAFSIEKLECCGGEAGGFQDAVLEETTFTSLVELSTITQTKGRLSSRKQRIVRVIVNLIDSQGGEISVDGGITWLPIIYDDAELFTGAKEVRVNSGNVEDPRVMIKCEGVDPFELISVEVDIDEQGTEAR
jgi:hypothetical protein